jgi:hypothetical protein
MKSGSYENGHVHHGGSATDAKGLVHRALACFPSILRRGDVGRGRRAAHRTAAVIGTDSRSERGTAG